MPPTPTGIMSCFGLRSSFFSPRDPDPDAHVDLTEAEALPDPAQVPTSLRFPLRRNYTFNSRSASQSHASTTHSPALLLPPEDPHATKRRLVVIRRQASFAPVTLSVGFRSRTGWQPLCSSRHNQDAIVVLLPLPDPFLEYSLFAVLDGHGCAAHRVSAFVAQSLASHLRAALTDDPASIAPALHHAYLRASSDLHANSILDIAMTGTTAVTLLVHGRTLTCANVGDSRIVLATERKGVVEAVPLTNDHLPIFDTERERVERAGGRVDSWSPAGVDTGLPRVWLKDRRMPGLAVTRVIGDSVLSGIVSPEPELTTHDLTSEDRFCIVASDGIWTVMSNDEVVSFVNDRPTIPCQTVAEELVRHAASLWFEEDGESIDDISAIVVRFNQP